MKRILILVMAVISLFAFSSCMAKDEDTRTYCFYKGINKESFWYECKITKDGETYNYGQALDADSVTTIEDHENDEDDGYAIYEFDNYYLHSLNFSTKKYDTTVTKEGVKFLFGQNDPEEFRAPAETEDEAEFNGKNYYCEIFKTLDKDGNAIGKVRYYFDGMTLVGIEWIEDGEVVTSIEVMDYTEEIPELVYTEIPEGFKAGNFIHEEVILPRS